MAINPIFGAQMPDLVGGVSAQSSGHASNAPAVLTPQRLDGQAADVLLSDLNASSDSTTGDPLIDDLNARDAGKQSNNSSMQNLNSFLLQQAKASFQASQAMDNQTPSSGSNGSILGNTSA